MKLSAVIRNIRLFASLFMGAMLFSSQASAQIINWGPVSAVPLTTVSTTILLLLLLAFGVFIAPRMKSRRNGIYVISAVLAGMLAVGVGGNLVTKAYAPPSVVHITTPSGPVGGIHLTPDVITLVTNDYNADVQISTLNPEECLFEDVTDAMFPRCNVNDILSPGQTCYVNAVCTVISKDICLEEGTSVHEINGSSAILCAKEALTHLHSDMSVIEGKFIELKQDGILEEVNASGTVVRNIILSGNTSWSPAVFLDGIFTSSYSATEETNSNSNNNPPVMFEKTVHFGILTRSTVENVQCTSCSGASAGVCQSPRRLNECKDSSAITGRCPRGFLPCTATVFVDKLTVAFSFKVSNFNFQDSTNKLRYRLNLKTKEDTHFFPSLNVKEDIFTNNGLLSVPTTAVIESRDGIPIEIINADATLDKSKENELSIELSFDAYPDDRVLNYN